MPEYIEMVARWCKQNTRMPVIVKLTPNITDIRYPARAAKAGGADAVSLINTISSITGVDLDTMSPEPSIDGKGSHGGYCGPAVKPIALNMVAEIARDAETRGLPISGIGGVTTWRDAAEFLALGRGQRAGLHRGHDLWLRIVKEMTAGLSDWMDEKGYASVAEISGRAVPNVTDWQYLNLNYVTKARIDQDALHQVRPLLRRLRGYQPPGDLDVARPRVRGDRRGMRGLQPLHQRLPGRGLHHDGTPAGRNGRPAHRKGRGGRLRQLDDASQQPRRAGRRIGGHRLRSTVAVS